MAQRRISRTEIMETGLVRLPFLRVDHGSTGCVLRCSERNVLSQRYNGKGLRGRNVRHRNLLQSPTTCFADPDRRTVRTVNVFAVVQSVRRSLTHLPHEPTKFQGEIGPTAAGNFVDARQRRTLSIVLFPILVRSSPARAKPVNNARDQNK